jgi:replicative DNA helicase
MGKGHPAERVPPHSQEAEIAVLGAVMLEPNAMSSVAPILQSECFYRSDHQKLYTAYNNLYNKDLPIDVVSVKEELRRMKEDGIADNTDLFVTLGGAVPSVANAEYYANVVREKYLLRALISSCNESLAEAYDERQDAPAILDRAEQRVFDVATRFEASHPTAVKEVLHSVIDDLGHPERLVGVQTGYPDVDHLTAGLHPSEFIVIGGRPSTGKTTFALNLIQHVGVQAGKGVLMFSLEMPTAQIIRNLLCCGAGVDASRLRSGQLDKEEWDRIREAASALYDSPVFIDDSGALNCSQLRSKCRRVMAKQDVDMIIIDYLQLMWADRQGRDISRLQEITDISRGLKALAKDLRVPVIALSQLSRAAESEATARPRLSHLRESGAIEQDADVVILLYRDPNPEPENEGLTELIVAKQRNGPTDTVRLTFLKNQMRFESWSGYSAAQVDMAEQDVEAF